MHQEQGSAFGTSSSRKRQGLTQHSLGTTASRTGPHTQSPLFTKQMLWKSDNPTHSFAQFFLGTRPCQGLFIATLPGHPCSKPLLLPGPLGYSPTPPLPSSILPPCLDPFDIPSALSQLSLGLTLTPLGSPHPQSLSVEPHCPQHQTVRAKSRYTHELRH